MGFKIGLKYLHGALRRARQMKNFRTVEGTIIVTDVSGFSRMCREYSMSAAHEKLQGIFDHQLSLMSKFSMIELVKTSGDNLIFFSNSRLEAVDFGILLTKNAISDHYLSVGIATGPVMRMPGDVFGITVNIACRLGEDVAAAGEVLVEVVADELDVTHGFTKKGVRKSGQTLVYWHRGSGQI